MNTNAPVGRLALRLVLLIAACCVETACGGEERGAASGSTAAPEEPATQDEPRIADVSSKREPSKSEPSKEEPGRKEPRITFEEALDLAMKGDEKAIDPLCSFLHSSEDFYVRLGAVTGLGELEAERAVPHLMKALDDGDTLVRNAAGQALERITGILRSQHPARQLLDRWEEWWKSRSGGAKDAPPKSKK